MRSTIVVLTLLVSVVVVKSFSLRQCKASEAADDPKSCGVFCKLLNTGKMDDKGKLILQNFIVKSVPAATKCAENNQQENLCKRAVAYKKCFDKAIDIAEYMEQNMQCANETNTIIDVSKKMSSKFDDKKACYHRCMLIKSGQLNYENVVNVKILSGSQDNKEDVTQKCYEENIQDDMCLQAIRRITCVKKELVLKNCKAAEVAANPKKCAALCKLQYYGDMDEKAEIILNNFASKYKIPAMECAAQNKQGNLCERGAAFKKCMEKTRSYMKKCANETNTVIEVDGKQELAANTFDDQKACYHRCVLIKARQMNEQNEVVSGSKFYKGDITQKCYKENKQKDKCLQAIRRMTCVKNEAAKSNHRDADPVLLG